MRRDRENFVAHRTTAMVGTWKFALKRISVCGHRNFCFAVWPRKNFGMQTSDFNIIWTLLYLLPAPAALS